MVSIVECGELNKWTLLPLFKYDLNAAKKRAIELGDNWCNNNLITAKNILGDKFAGCLKWENLLNDKQLNYEEERKVFGKLCDKQIVCEKLHNTINSYKITDKESFLQNKKKLENELHLLLPTNSRKKNGDRECWKNVSWENAMIATVLEYMIRCFSRSTKEQTNNSLSFIEFVNRFTSNAYEHQAEKTTMLYFCLPKVKEYNFSDFIYPNKEAPIFKKAYFEKTQSSHLCRWQEVKINYNEKKELLIKIGTFFNNLPLKQSEKIDLANLIAPSISYINRFKTGKREQITVATMMLFGSYVIKTDEINKGITSPTSTKDVSLNNGFDLQIQ
jgi:hypothetical protein